MKQIILSVMLLATTLSLTACNTVAGFGEDVQRSGHALERSAERHGADR